MKKKSAETWQAPYNLPNDPLSSFVREFTFAPHSFGHQYKDPAAECGDRIMGDFELIFVVGGENRITVGRQEYICGRGDVVLIPPFAVNKIKTPRENPHDNYWVHFDLYPFYRHGDFVSALLGRSGARMKVECVDELLDLYRRMEREVDLARPGGKACIELLFSQIILTLLRLAGNVKAGSEGFLERNTADMAMVNRCLEYIHGRVGEPIRLEELCERLHISQSYLFKSFSRVMKISPNNYIRLYKAKRAEQLIKTTDFSIKEISDRLGFTSQYYFSSVFKQYYHMSPREYRNRFYETRM